MWKRITLLIPLLLAAACGTPEIDGGHGESEQALTVKAGARSLRTITAVDLAATKDKTLRLDLSKPEMALLFDGSKGVIELDRVEVVLEGDVVVPALELAKAAGQSVNPKVTSRFVLSAPSRLISGGGGGKCSPTQTDCCECDFRLPGPNGTGICVSFWCSCDEFRCGPVVLL